MISITLDDVLEESLIQESVDRVSSKKRMPGVDNISAEVFQMWWNRNKDIVIKDILDGKYKPRDALKIMINKSGSNKKRILEVPCMVDKMIETAIHKVLSSEFNKLFSDNSFGFIEGRGTKPALYKCLEYMNSGERYIIDMDICSCFDNISHFVIKERLNEEIEDKRLVDLIMKYVRTRVRTRKGNIYVKRKGISQGSPLSPLLANIALDYLDKVLEMNGINFVRYADDIVIFCKTHNQAIARLLYVERVLDENLNLKINNEKTNIVKPDQLIYLGYAFRKVDRKYELAVNDEIALKAAKHIDRNMRKHAKNRLDRIDRLGSFNRGWVNYYIHSDERSLFKVIKFIDNEEYKKIAEECRKSNMNMILLYDSKHFVSMQEWYLVQKSR